MLDIPTAAADNIKVVNTNAAMGVSSTPDKIIGADDGNWNNELTPKDYEFTMVNSMEELEAEFRSTPRDISEVVISCTETPKNLDLNSREIFDYMVERGPNRGLYNFWHY